VICSILCANRTENIPAFFLFQPARQKAAVEQGESALPASHVTRPYLLCARACQSLLIAAVVGRLVDRCESEQGTALAADPQSAGAFTRAYLAARIRPPDPQEEPVHIAVLTALGTDPEYLEPLRKRVAEWQTRLESDGLRPRQLRAS